MIQGSAGTAVTAFITEYRYQPERDGPNYSIIASCLNNASIDENLGELLEDFRKPYLVGPDELTATEFEAAEDRSEAARTIFETAFGKMQGFSLELVTYEEGGYDAAFQVLKGWACQLEWPAEIQNGQWQATADNEEECQAKTEPFLNLGLWPFVQKVVCVHTLRCTRNDVADKYSASISSRQC